MHVFININKDMFKNKSIQTPQITYIPTLVLCCNATVGDYSFKSSTIRSNPEL